MKEKEKINLEHKKIIDSFKDSPLSKLTVPELKFLLHDHFQQRVHSSRTRKADFLAAVSQETKKDK